MNAHDPAQAPASIIAAPASVADDSANDVVEHTPAEIRLVRVAITDSATNTQRRLVVPFAELSATYSGLSPTQRLGPVYSDEDDPDEDIGTILVFASPPAPDEATTPAELWHQIGHDDLTRGVPCIGIPCDATDDESKAAYFILPLDGNDHQSAAWIGAAVVERSLLAGAKNYAYYRPWSERLTGSCVGVHLNAADSVPKGLAQPCLCADGDSALGANVALGTKEWLTPSERSRLHELLPALTADELKIIKLVDEKNQRMNALVRGEAVPSATAEELAEAETRRELAWFGDMSDYEQAANLLGSAEPVFLAAIRDLSGPEVWIMLAKLQAAAEYDQMARYPSLAAIGIMDPATAIVRNQAVPIAVKYREFAADRARFDLLLTTQLRQNAEYRALPDYSAALVRLAAWLFVAPASLFVGKGAATISPLIVPGHGEPRKTTWFVEGLMPSIGVGALVGGAGEGKSYIAADLAARVATVPPDGVAKFANRAISGAPSVLYCGCEGVDGWTIRAERQLQYVSGRPATEPHGLRIADGVPPLSSPITALRWIRDQIDKIVKDGSPSPSIVIIDHLRGAMTGNEDNSGDMDLALSTAWAIARMCGCFVSLIHHARKNSGGGDVVARGSSALKANLDVEATVKKTNNSYCLTVTKNRNGVEGETFSWHIPAIDAPLHQGAAVSTTPDDRKISERRSKAAGRAVWEHATKTNGITKTELNSVLVEDYPDLFTDKGQRVGWRLQRARTDAIRAGYIAEGKKNSWIPGDTKPPSELAAPPEDFPVTDSQL